LAPFARTGTGGDPARLGGIAACAGERPAMDGRAGAPHQGWLLAPINGAPAHRDAQRLPLDSRLDWFARCCALAGNEARTRASVCALPRGRSRACSIEAMRWAKNAKDGKQPARGLRRMRAPSGAGGDKQAA